MLNDLGYNEKLEAIDKAILVNANFLAQIVEDPEIFGHDLDEETTLAESDSATASCTHYDIGRYWHFEKNLSHSNLKAQLNNNLPHTRIHTLIPLGIVTVMGVHQRDPIRRGHTNHPIPTWINSEVLLSSSFVIGAKRLLSPLPIRRVLIQITSFCYVGKARTRVMLQANEGRVDRVFRHRSA